MIRYSKSYLHSLSQKNCFLEGNLEKVLRLFDALDFIFSDQRLKTQLVLKGGTAINLIYARLPRLSVDIDLDYVGAIDAETAKKNRPQILEAIERHLASEGYSLSNNLRSHYALSSETFFYSNAGGNRDSIKIEINFLDRVHVLDPLEKAFSLFGKNHQVFVLKKEELYASKLVALLDRTKPRDLYDVYHHLQGGPILDEAGFRMAFLFYLAIDDLFDFPADLIDRVGLLASKDIRTELKPVLAKTDPFVLSDAQAVVKKYLLSLTPNEEEKAFLISAKAKVFDFSLLSNDSLFIERMNHHPMVLWKKRDR